MAAGGCYIAAAEEQARGRVQAARHSVQNDLIQWTYCRAGHPISARLPRRSRWIADVPNTAIQYVPQIGKR